MELILRVVSRQPFWVLGPEISPLFLTHGRDDFYNNFKPVRGFPDDLVLYL